MQCRSSGNAWAALYAITLGRRRYIDLTVAEARLLVLCAAAQWLLSLRTYSRATPAAAAGAGLVQRAALAVQAVIAIGACAALALALGL